MIEFRQARWFSVYGATIALLVREKFNEGRGAADDADMDQFEEEAISVADAAEEATNRLTARNMAAIR